MASFNGSIRAGGVRAPTPIEEDTARATSPSVERPASPEMGASRAMLGAGNNRLQANLMQGARAAQDQRNAQRANNASPQPIGTFGDNESIHDRPAMSRTDSGANLPIQDHPDEHEFTSILSPRPRSAGNFAFMESARSTPAIDAEHEEIAQLQRDLADRHSPALREEGRISPALSARINTPASEEHELYEDPPEVAPETHRQANRRPAEGMDHHAAPTGGGPGVLETLMNRLRGPNGDQEVTRAGLRDGINQKIDELEPEISRHNAELQDLHGRQPAPGTDAHAAWQAEWHQKTQDMHDLLNKKHALVMEKEKMLEDFERQHPADAHDPNNPMAMQMAMHRQMMTEQMENQMKMMRMSQEFESIQSAMSILQKAHQTQNDLLSGSFSHSMESFLKNAI